MTHCTAPYSVALYCKNMVRILWLGLEYSECGTIFLSYYFSEYGINIPIILTIFLQYNATEYGAVHPVTGPCLNQESGIRMPIDTFSHSLLTCDPCIFMN